MRRRSFIVSSATVVSLSLAGCLGDDEEPDSVVRSFLEAADDNDRDRIDELLHPDHTDAISDDRLHFFEIADITIRSVTITSQDDGEAVVTTEYDMETEDATITPEEDFILRSDDGTWLVYDWETE